MPQPLAFLSNDVPVLGPIGVAVSTLGTTAAQVIAADPVRRGIVFHNPGNVVIRIAPANVALVSGSGGIVIYPQSDFILLDDNPLFNVNCAWNAVADSGSNNTLTIFNFTDANSSVAAPNARSQLNYSIPQTSPSGTAVSGLGTASTQVIAANPTRRGVLFHNPGSVNVAVCPANLTAVIGAGSRIIFPGSEFRLFAAGRVRVNCAWKAIAASGAANKLTVLEFL